jgi:hypothetical protein
MISAMGFDDLPDGWADQALSDPLVVIADVLDLFVLDRDRRRGALYALLCDDGDRIQVPVVVDELGDGGALEERVHMFGVFAEAVATNSPGGSMLVAVARGGGLSLTPDDHLWRQGAEQACAREHVRLLGVHLVTPDGSRLVPRTLDSAA